MSKKHYIRQNTHHNYSYHNQNNPFTTDPIEAERLAQRQEYLRRKDEGEGSEKNEETCLKPTAVSKTKGLPKSKHPYRLNWLNNNDTRLKSKELTLEEKLAVTWKWLSDNFPDLFGAEAEIKPLDVHIVRDIKDHYEKHQLEKGYPKDLAIKATLYRYMESPEYLACLQEGATRYDLYGSIVGKVNIEEIKK